MGFGDDKAEIVEDIAKALPGGGDSDAESDGDDALAAAGGGELCGRGLRRAGRLAGLSLRRAGCRDEAGAKKNGDDQSFHGLLLLHGRSRFGIAAWVSSALRSGVSRGRW